MNNHPKVLRRGAYEITKSKYYKYLLFIITGNLVPKCKKYRKYLFIKNTNVVCTLCVCVCVCVYRARYIYTGHVNTSCMYAYMCVCLYCVCSCIHS